MAISAEDALVVADMDNQVVRRIDSRGRIETIAGTGVPGDAEERAPAAKATFRNPGSVCVDDDGSVLVANTDNGAVRPIGTDGFVTTLRDGFRDPADIVVLADHDYAVAETGRNRVLRLSSDADVATLAGMGASGYGAMAERPRRHSSTAPARWRRGLRSADRRHGNRLIRRVTPDGRIGTVAGIPPNAEPSTGATRLGALYGIAEALDGRIVVSQPQA